MSELSLTQVQAKLGFTVTGDFLTDDLGVAPARTDKRAKFWNESQFGDICDKLILHVNSVKTGTKVVAARVKTPKPAKEVDPFS